MEGFRCPGKQIGSHENCLSLKKMAENMVTNPYTLSPCSKTNDSFYNPLIIIWIVSSVAFVCLSVASKLIYPPLESDYFIISRSYTVCMYSTNCLVSHLFSHCFTQCLSGFTSVVIGHKCIQDILHHIQSTLVISKLKGPSETFRDIRISTYQIFRIEENTNRTTIYVIRLL